MSTPSATPCRKPGCRGAACGRCQSEARLVELSRRLAEAGCFERAPRHYAIRSALVVLAVAGGYAGFLADPGWPARVAVALLVAFASVQAAFVAHEIGDGALTRNRRTSRSISAVMMTFLTGVSATYFDHLHQLHHRVVSLGPRAGTESRVLVNPYEVRWLKRALSRNPVLFVLGTTCLRALTFRIESLRFAWRNPRAARRDRALLALHYALWLLVPAVALGPGTAALNYALIALLAGPYIGLVLIINHEGMSRAESLAALPVVDRVVRSTRNLPASRLNDVVFGGVNNHIEHHLFPEVPAARLPRARRIAEAYLREAGYAYTVTRTRAAMRSAMAHFRALSPEQRVAEALS